MIRRYLFRAISKITRLPLTKSTMGPNQSSMSCRPATALVLMESRCPLSAAQPAMISAASTSTTTSYSRRTSRKATRKCSRGILPGAISLASLSVGAEAYGIDIDQIVDDLLQKIIEAARQVAARHSSPFRPLVHAMLYGCAPLDVSHRHRDSEGKCHYA